MNRRLATIERIVRVDKWRAAALVGGFCLLGVALSSIGITSNPKTLAFEWSQLARIGAHRDLVLPLLLGSVALLGVAAAISVRIKVLKRSYQES